MTKTALVLCVLAFGSCKAPAREVADSELPGTYEKRSGGELDVITIRSDGTYVHNITRQGKTITQTGDWSALRDGKLLWVNLSRFDTSGWPEGMPEGGQVLEYSAPVEVDRDRITLVVSSDLGYRYVKK